MRPQSHQRVHGFVILHFGLRLTQLRLWFRLPPARKVQRLAATWELSKTASVRGI